MAQAIGSNFKSVKVTSVTQLVAPSENVNGLRLCTASLHIANYYMSLTVGTKAPTSYTDLTVPVVLALRGPVVTGSNGFPGASTTLPFSIEIPAGQGLWAASGDIGYVFLTYDLL